MGGSIVHDRAPRPRRKRYLGAMTSPGPWDERYGTDEYVYGTAPNDFLVEVASMIPDGPVLCIGDGEGRNSVYLAGLGHAVTAVDGSPVGLKKGQALAATRRVSVEAVCARLEDFVFPPEHYAAVVSIFCHLPSALRKLVHGRAAKALRPDGVFVLEAYTPRQLKLRTGGPGDVDLLPTLADLRADFTDLEMVVGRELERDVLEGKLHQGLSAVVQVVAKKTS